MGWVNEGNSWLTHCLSVWPCRAIEAGEAELADMAAGIAELDQQHATLGAEAADKASDIEGLRTEKEIQAGGEVKELQQQVDELAIK